MNWYLNTTLGALTKPQWGLWGLFAIAEIRFHHVERGKDASVLYGTNLRDAG